MPANPAYCRRVFAGTTACRHGSSWDSRVAEAEGILLNPWPVFSHGFFIDGNDKSLQEKRLNENTLDWNDGHHISFGNGNSSRDVCPGKDVSLPCRECELTQVRCADEG